ncbi:MULTISPECIES: DUF3325 domain-containing protein [unclassified Acinetobacter]|uniref:DUF3325 domain-containing protein n=1 Tax=unclassified Acinetobacter TaxID=196816 RepID=UPI00293526EE|nr:MULTISPECIES: DUF3325 domain-containing protein [unclassified Acinetobacter]WOE31653.1 DUF3325 domain-containing protein [Acinetobacter sp. SAAs470]WOE37118.1 DUF3325 domain-containing protein [Acinetobacter sp. SAAs474]
MMFFLLIWAITTLGFFCLACSMSKHQKQIFAHELSRQQCKFATVIGWILLLIAASLCLLPYPLSNAISYWLGSVTFAGLFVGLSLSYQAHHIKMIALIVTIVAFCSVIGSLI